MSFIYITQKYPVKYVAVSNYSAKITSLKGHWIVIVWCPVVKMKQLKPGVTHCHFIKLKTHRHINSEAVSTVNK